MKRLLAIAVLSFASVAASAAGVDMPFFDAAGFEYTTGNYRDEMAGRYPGTRPTLFLVVTRDAGEPEFVQQMAVLERLDAEALQLVFVVGTPSPADRSGYWLEPENVDALLEDGDRFRFIAIADGGEVCYSSNEAVQREQIVTSGNTLQPAFLRCVQERS